MEWYNICFMKRKNCARLFSNLFKQIERINLFRVLLFIKEITNINLFRIFIKEITG